MHGTQLFTSKVISFNSASSSSTASGATSSLFSASPLFLLSLFVFQSVSLGSPACPGIFYVDKAGLELLMIFLPLSTEYWDYKCAPPYPATQSLNYICNILEAQKSLVCTLLNKDTRAEFSFIFKRGVVCIVLYSEVFFTVESSKASRMPHLPSAFLSFLPSSLPLAPIPPSFSSFISPS